MTELLEIKKFVKRDDFIIEKVSGKSVLHLGCIGETDSNVMIKLKRAPYLLHHKIKTVSPEVYGIDIDADAIDLYGRELGEKNLIVGDVEHLETINIPRKFEVILFTDLMEHLSNPGLALTGIKKFLSTDGEVIISVPHSFGLPNFIRYAIGRFKEGNQHVATYNSANLKNLLERLGFKICEIYSAYESIPKGIKVLFLLPLLVLKILPKFGGTLLIVAKLVE